MKKLHLTKRGYEALRILVHVMFLGFFVFAVIAAIMAAKANATNVVRDSSTVKTLIIGQRELNPGKILPGYSVEIDGKKYPLYKTTKSYYYWRTSKKTGKRYKCYLTKKQKEQLGL